MPSGYAMEPAEDDRKVIPLSQTPFSDLETLPDDPDDPFSHAYFCNAEILSLSTNPQEKEKGLAIFREMAADVSHPYHAQAVVNVFCRGTEEDKKRANSKLENIREKAQQNIYPKDFTSAELLWLTNKEEDITIAHSIYSQIIQDSTHPHYLEAVDRLINGSNPEFSEGTLFNLLPLFSLRTVNDKLSWSQNKLLHEMLSSPYPHINKRAEDIFLENPLKFMSFFDNISAFLIEQEESKKNVFLQRICEALSSTSLENLELIDRNHLFNAAYLILQMNDQEQFVTPAKKVFLKLMDNELVRHIDDIRPPKDTELREMMFSYLFTLAESINLNKEEEGCHSIGNGINERGRALLALLKQDDEKVRMKAIALCQRLIESINPSHMQQSEFLSQVGLALNEIEKGKALSQQVLGLLCPKFEQILNLGFSSKDYCLIEIFLKMGNADQQLKIFNFIKERIMSIKDGSSTESENSVEGSDSESSFGDFEDDIELITDTLGVDHPWSKELIKLAAKRANCNDLNSPFSVYKQLCEQMDQPVDHHRPKFQLEDKRWVTFNLKTLQARRQLSCLPMKYDELVGFTKRLLAEAQEHPEKFQLCATEVLRLDQSIALQEINTAFFKNLLDMDEEQKDVQRQSLTSSKLRHILTAAKGLQDQENKGHPFQGITPSSQLILSLLNNVLTCPTGKEDGIDATYRLLTNRRGSSEQELQGDRLSEEMHEFFKEEMRCMRETVLSGNGPVVRSLLNPSMTDEKELKKVKVEEAPHQAKYLGNLLGAETGLFLEGKGVTFDQNGGCVSSELRKCSKQEALDKLYEYHTPKDAIRHFHELFKAQGFKGKIDGKNTLSDIIAEFLPPEQLVNPDYIIFDDSEMPIGLTPLAVAEILFKLNILEVVERLVVKKGRHLAHTPDCNGRNWVKAIVQKKQRR